jgi:hypothetical protein
MAPRRVGLAMLLLLPLATVIAYTGWRLHTAAGLCGTCGRPIQARTATEGLVDGRAVRFCCPACALTDHRQTGQAVRVTALTDYDTGARLSPNRAYAVVGSDVNLCLSEHVLMQQHAEADPLAFDRCTPSIMAFGEKSAAERFAAEHGGRLLPFGDLMPAYSR